MKSGNLNVSIKRERDQVHAKKAYYTSVHSNFNLKNLGETFNMAEE